jgi:2-keto-3-deoxy-L-rhamnonate aldolase RhmA
MTSIAEPPAESNRWAVLALLGTAQLMVVLDSTIVNIALPSAQRALHFSTSDRVDVLFVGPADLGHALGIDGGADHPDLLAAGAAVSDAALRHGKAAGILAASVAQLEHYHRLGFTFLGCAADSALLMQRAQEVSATIHALAKP